MVFELSLLEHESVAEFAATVCSGPGPRAIERCIESLADSASPVVLVGVAGGLSDRVQTGQCSVVTAVRTQTSDDLILPTIAAPLLKDAPQCIVCSVDEPVTAVESKRSLGEQTGADLVDTESHVFARCCAARGFEWAVVRGVSDGRDESLPAELVDCVDATGRPQTGRAALFALRKPALVPAMLRLRRNSITAMKQAAELLRELAGAL